MATHCDWCSADGAGQTGARWLMGALRHTTGPLTPTGAHHQVKRHPRPVWACDECAPLVRAHDVDALAARARANVTDESVSALEHALIFRAIDRALVTELAGDDERPDRPSRADMEAFAVASAQAGTNTFGAR